LRSASGMVQKATGLGGYLHKPPQALCGSLAISESFASIPSVMPSLNDHGKLAAAIIPFYVPILLISFMLVLRHGFRRESGWIFLFIFSISTLALSLTLNSLGLILFFH
jgi:FtsH-binding integral membrane protein